MGADPCSIDLNGDTALHHVMRQRYIDNDDIVRLLIDYGANVNQKNNQGNTPLHFAAWSAGHSYYNFKKNHLIDVLLEKGGNPNLENDLGSTP